MFAPKARPSVLTPLGVNFGPISFQILEVGNEVPEGTDDAKHDNHVL